MKKILLISLSAVALMLSSCAEFLNTQTWGEPTVDNYFNNDDQAVMAVKRAFLYLPGEDMLGRNLYWEQAASLEMVYGRSTSWDATVPTMEVGGDELKLGYAYKDITNGIAIAQWIVGGLEEKRKERELSPIETRSLGEAYFARAIWHFYLAYRYGLGGQGAPFKPWEDYEGGYNNEIPPMPKSVVDNYIYIIRDLEKAEELLPWEGSIRKTYSGFDLGRPHKASACAMQAKVYTYMATWSTICEKRGIDAWAKVVECVNKLDRQTPGNLYDRELNPSFSNLWTSDFDGDYWNDECCYSIPSTGGATGGPVEFGGIIVENGGWGKFNGWGQMKPTVQMYEEFAKDNNQGVDPATGKEIKNERLAKSILEYGDVWQYWGEDKAFYNQSDIEAGFAIKKYMDALKYADPIGEGYLHPSGNWPCTRVNFHIIRFAECLLLRAEANMHIKGVGNAESTADINRVRVRSKLTPIASATWAALHHERWCELAFEMTDHAHDLKRWAQPEYGVPEIAEIAINELTTAPLVRNYKNRMDPHSELKGISVYANFTGLKEDGTPGRVWKKSKIAFKYPSAEITKSGGLYQQIDYDKDYDAIAE